MQEVFHIIMRHSIIKSRQYEIQCLFLQQPERFLAYAALFCVEEGAGNLFDFALVGTLPLLEGLSALGDGLS